MERGAPAPVTGEWRLGDAGPAMLVPVAALGLGTVALRWLGMARADPVPRLVAGLAVGATVLLAAGFGGLYVPAAAWALTAVGVASSATAWRALRLQGADACGELRRVLAGDVAAIGAAGVIVLTLAASFVSALMPPTMFDSLTHHLVRPQQAILAHKVFAMPWLSTSWHPATAEMEFGWAMLIGSGAARGGGWSGAALINMMHVPLVILATWRLARGLGLAAGAGLAAAAVLAVAPMTQVLARQPMADLQGVTCATLAAAAAFTPPGAGGSILAAACWAGVAMATKWTSGALAVLACLFAVPGRRWSSGHVGGCAVALLLPMAPMAIRNWLEAGAPFHPLLTGSIERQRLAEWMQYCAVTPRSASGALLLPLHLTLGSPDLARYDLHFAGALFAGLYLVPLCFNAPRMRPAASWLVAGWLLGYAMYASPRHVLALLPVCAVLWFRVPPRRIGAGWRLALLLALAAVQPWEVLDQERVWAGLGYDGVRLLESGRGQWPQPACRWIDEHLPTSSRFALVGDGQSYYASRRSFGSLVHDVSVVEAVVHVSPDLAAVRRRLRQSGIGYVLAGGIEVWPGQRRMAFRPGREERLLNHLLDPAACLYRDPANPYAVFRVRPAREEPRVRLER